MKGTFDDKDITFWITIGNNHLENGKYIETPFVSDLFIEGKFYGSNPTDMCNYYEQESFILTATKRHQKNYCQTSKLIINPNGGLTFEDTIKAYIIKNFKGFNDMEKLHALCFLERYCMDYKDVAKFIRKK